MFFGEERKLLLWNGKKVVFLQSLSKGKKAEMTRNALRYCPLTEISAKYLKRRREHFVLSLVCVCYVPSIPSGVRYVS